MAKQLINLGTPNGRDGDTVRVAFNKINDNFSELYVGLDLLNIATNVRPATDSIYDLGGVDRKWHALWLDLEGVHIGENRLSVNEQGAVTVNGEVVATPNGDPVQADWLATSGASAILNKPVLSAVATSNDYRQLSHKPTIPTLTSQLTNDAGFTSFSGSWTDLTNKPTLFNGSYLSLTNRPSLFSGSYLDLVHRPTLFSGSYLDLTNTPTIPHDINQLTDVDSLLGAGASGGSSDRLVNGSNSLILSSGGSLQLANGAGINLQDTGGVELVAGPGVDSYSGLTYDYRNWIYVDSVAAYIEASDGYSGNTWTFTNDGKLHLPVGGTIVDSNGTNILDGLGGGGISISDFGEGFSLTAANKVVTNKLYSTNQTHPNQHYRLTLDTNGVVVLPDQSIINGSTLRGIYGTGEANYTGITIGPDAAHQEESWMYVDHTGSYIATQYNTNQRLWQFKNDGSTIFPSGAGFGRGDNGQLKVNDGVTLSLDIRDNYGRGFYTNNSGYTLRSNGTYSWIFDESGILNLPNSVTGAPLIQATNEIQLNADGSTFTFGADGNLYVPNEIHSVAGVGPVVIEANDGTLRTWTFGGDGFLTLPSGAIIVNNGNALSINPQTGTGALVQISAGSNDTDIGGELRLYAGMGGDIGMSGNIDIFGHNTVIRTEQGRWTFGSDGLLTFPGEEGFRATFGSVAPIGDVLHSVNSLYLESELTVNLTSGNQVADLEAIYNDSVGTLNNAFAAQLWTGAGYPASHTSYHALSVAKALNPLIPDAWLPLAQAVMDAHDAWQSALSESEVNISVAGSNVWNFGADGKLTLPNGATLFNRIPSSPGTGPQPASGRTLVIAPSSSSSTKTFNFRIDESSNVFTRAYLDMPASAVDKQVAISFPLVGGGVGYIFNQGADTNDLGMNNAFNIMHNGGDVKITAEGAGPTFNTWTFGVDGNLTFPDATEQSTAFQDVPSHIFFVHPSPGRTFTATGTYNSPFATIAAANAAAVTAGHDDSNPAVIVLMANTIENVTLKPGIFLTSFGTGTHGSPTITGTVTVTSSTGTTVTNHYSISNLRIVAPNNTSNCIYFTGNAPQKLFVRDMWIDAKGTGTGILMDNTGSGSTLQLDIAHIAHSGSGDVYCIDVTKGNCYITDIETTGAIQVAAVRTGCVLTIDSSELDATGDVVCETYGTGSITITNSIINNTQANGNGIKLNDLGGVATLGNNLISVPVGSGYVVQGITGTVLYAANNVFLTANTARSTAITYVALPTTWSTKS